MYCGDLSETPERENTAARGGGWLDQFGTEEEHGAWRTARGHVAAGTINRLMASSTGADHGRVQRHYTLVVKCQAAQGYPP